MEDELDLWDRRLWENNVCVCDFVLKESALRLQQEVNSSLTESKESLSISEKAGSILSDRETVLSIIVLTGNQLTQIRMQLIEICQYCRLN